MDYLLGIDVGSTTVKLALTDSSTGEVCFHRYRRHGARQREVAAELLLELEKDMPGVEVRPVFTGSGGGDLARRCGIGHVQEVVANSVAVQRFHPRTRVAIELGGQDAKVIFFHADPVSGELHTSDMRMNGSCAGGTGAFIDEIAKLLRTPIEEFNDLASAGSMVYQISGRCGVFAKTDIQPLLNQGVDRSNLALSTFHAIARQTIGGLAQGLRITPPVIFQGGPLTFNPVLISVFAELLALQDDQIIIPANPEIFVAHGAALSLSTIFPETEPATPGDLSERLRKMTAEPDGAGSADNEPDVFFSNDDERRAFENRHRRP